MIRELDSKSPTGGEKFGDHLNPVEWAEEIMYRNQAVGDRLLKKGQPDLTGGWETTPRVVDGFEDLLGDQPLGQGLFDNHTGGARQLVFAIAISSDPEINKIIDKGNLGDSREMIRQMRAKQVLSGLKIIDLGCGSGSFAVAAKSLGAEVYTADAEDLSRDRKKLLDGHIVLNLGDKDAASRLMNETGGNFDLVTENIIGRGWNDKLRLIPHDQFESTIRQIADVLLKKGGYLYGSEFGIASVDGPFKKA